MKKSVTLTILSFSIFFSFIGCIPEIDASKTTVKPNALKGHANRSSLHSDLSSNYKVKRKGGRTPRKTIMKYHMPKDLIKH